MLSSAERTTANQVLGIEGSETTRAVSCRIVSYRRVWEPTDQLVQKTRRGKFKAYARHMRAATYIRKYLYVSIGKQYF